jgi:hypothetical protein
VFRLRCGQLVYEPSAGLNLGVIRIRKMAQNPLCEADSPRKTARHLWGGAQNDAVTPYKREPPSPPCCLRFESVKTVQVRLR